MMPEITVVISSIVAFLGIVFQALWMTRSRNPESSATINSTNTDTILKMAKQIHELYERDALNEGRIDKLESELKRFRNAYAKAIKYIYDKNPLEVIPNFLESDPDIMSIKK